mgnify:FL=1
MIKKHLVLGLCISLITACTSAAITTPNKQTTDLTEKVISSEVNFNHVYDVDTKVVQIENSTEQHVYSAETQVTPFINSTTLTVGERVLLGTWQGGISMGDHEHPLTFTTKEINGRLSTSYSFWGMDTRGMGNANEDDKTIDFKNGAISFILPESGVKFTSHAISKNEINGTVEWMGLSQSMQFKRQQLSKLTDKEPEHSMSEHAMPSNKPLNIAILVFDGVDVLDWAGPLEVFVNAHSFNVFTVASTMKAFDGGNYQVTPKYTFANMPKADILIVPGGSVAPLFHQPETMAWIKATSKHAAITMSVCNAANLLAGASMLKGLEATTHSSWIKWLDRQSSQQSFTVVRGSRFVDNGKIITTAGVSSGIDGALHVVARLKGLAHARMTASMIEYNWQPENIEQYQ